MNVRTVGYFALVQRPPWQYLAPTEAMVAELSPSMQLERRIPFHRMQLRNCSSFPPFKKPLKTFLFRDSFSLENESLVLGFEQADLVMLWKQSSSLFILSA